MNIADSLKHVLKNRSTSILSDFWKRDLKMILMNFGHDITEMYQAGVNSLQGLKKDGINISAKELGESLIDMVLILKVMPSRIKSAVGYFKEDLLNELESQEDSKQKALFSLKVLGAVTSLTLGIFYGIKKGQTEFKLKGLKRRNAFTRFIVAELIFKITQHFLQRILEEIEEELSDPDDSKNIRYFRQLLSERPEPGEDQEIEPHDKAIEIVEKFKSYLITGKREE